MKNLPSLPPRQGLYRPEEEKDSCGVGLVVKIDGSKAHEIIDEGLRVLENMAHRGAEGADNKSGDGAGILMQIPHEFILLQGIPVPEKGRYATGLVFFPREERDREELLSIIRSITEAEGLTLMYVRDLPVNSDILGEAARATEPVIKQIFVTGYTDAVTFARKIYCLRKKIENRVAALNENGRYNDFYVVSLSTTTLIYKGMLTSGQLRYYFGDLMNPYLTSAIALVHSRFSTNTFPTWALAQPFRMLCHNGEINTIRGNRSWMHAHESDLKDDDANIEAISPIVQPDMSDSASLDNVLEYFVSTGMSIPHALAMLVPESINQKNPISDDLRAFYEYHSIFMEPWDGPASLLFSDGRYAGGMLDRNGLRPSRFFITNDDVMVVASETGVLDIPAGEIKKKGRLRPGKIMLIDTKTGKILEDAQIKRELAEAHPYKSWLDANCVELRTLSSGRKVSNDIANYERTIRAFGYTKEDIEKILLPMSNNSQEPVGSMGNDTPLAALSQKPQIFYNYFKQQFAQVTNPPIDPIREELVMSTTSYIGAIKGNILQPSPEHCKVVKSTTPILTNGELDLLKHLQYKGFKTLSLPMLFNPAGGSKALEEAVQGLCHEADAAVDSGYSYVILSDRGVDATHAPIPSLLALSAVHHYLVQQKKRSKLALIVETGDAREVMHMALLVGFGASAVNPYMAFTVINDLVKKGELQLDFASAEQHYIQALNKGIMKIMSKMGISTVRSYRGAQIFESLGLAESVLKSYFEGMTSSIGGADIEAITRDILYFHEQGYGDEYDPESQLMSVGNYAYRRNGEAHAWNPDTISTLQIATRLGSYKKFKEFTRMVDEKRYPMFLRDMLEIKSNPIDIEEVEPVEEIVKHFVTSAMSFGALSKEAHETLAIAMNRLGGMSNTGEGGEDTDRYHLLPGGDDPKSAVKQVASARFGVNAEYLVNAKEIQIKVAQGAKPGEGGQLPGFKVDEMIAKTRHSLPGITLISPPPHHDIYSIEDLAQLIFDLRNVNPAARISVKLVSESGVGIIAAGVAKAKADMILISGGDGGTGASPMSSVKHAGIPFELGLAEAQQTLLLNNLRGEVVLQADGQIKSGRDVIAAALLGAEEFGFGTVSLIVMGCTMMRKCNLNTCPTGIATQSPELRAHFMGKVDYVVNYFTFLAQEVREHLAQMGFRRLEDIVGRTDLLTQRSYDSDSICSKIDLSKLLYRPQVPEGYPLHHTRRGLHQIDRVLDNSLISMLQPAIETGRMTNLTVPIHNTDRSAGAMLSGVVVAKHGAAGLPENTINVTFKGSAGQSFGAFLAPGITFNLQGDANDYVGKSLSGGKIIITPPAGTNFAAEENIIVGNTLLYGATSGEVYINGQAGERFAVRNSGATAVVEGVGDHCCEYMTGGRVVVLGETGRNFAAGMSGGIAYVWNKSGNFDYFCNMSMVELSLLEDAADIKELYSLINAHYRATASPLAARMMEHWDEFQCEFIKVMPYEYKKVLAAKRMADLEAKIAQTAIIND